MAIHNARSARLGEPISGLRGRLADGRAVSISIVDGRVAGVDPAEGGGELLLLPAFIDTHVHLDKALIRPELREHDGTLAGAIAAIHERKRRYTAEDVRNRAAAVIREHVRHGTTRLRSHVDVDTIGGLVALEGVLLAARECSAIAEVQTIAFPQEGLLRDPGTAELMEEAMAMGCQVVGGMPHWETSVEDQLAHVRFCFDLAERYDRDLDLHVDETDDGAVRTLEMVADEALRRGLLGRVTVGHVCALAAADEDYSRRVIEKCAQAAVTVVSNPVTNLELQGRGDRGLVRRGTTRIADFRAAGVNLCFGQDCILDGFYPFGRGDMLEVALISAHAAHLATTAELTFALEAMTSNPARAWRLAAYGLAPGARADIVAYTAPSWPEVLRLQQPPAMVVHAGRLVARNQVTSELA